MFRKIILVVILSIFLSCFSVAENVFDIKDRIRSVLEGQFSKILGKAVTIESLEGNLYKKITLNKVTIARGNSLEKGVFAYADKIEIQYDLKDILLSKFDLLPNLKEIKIYEPYISLERDISGNWNLFSAQPNEPKAQSQENIVADLKVYIIGGRGKFMDSRGWSKKPLANKFETELREINAVLGLKNENFSVDIKSQIPGDKKYNQLVLQGSFDLITEAFKLKIKTSDINLKNFSYYTLTQEDFTINKGKADVDLLIKSKGSLAKNALDKLEISAEIGLRDGELMLPKLMRYPLRRITSTVTIAQKQINIKNLKASLDDRELTVKGIISEYEQKYPTLSLALSINKLPLQKLSDYFLMIKTDPQVKGSADLDLQLSGKLNSLEAKAKLFSKDTYYQKISLQDVSAELHYLKEELNLEFSDKGIFAGAVEGELIAVLNKENIVVKRGRVQFKNINTQQLVNSKLITGNVAGVLELAGPLNELSVSADAVGQVQIYEQKFTKLNVILSKTNKIINFQKLDVNINGQDLILSGSLEGSLFQLYADGQILKFKKEEMLKNIDSVCDITATVNGFINGDLQQLPQSLQADADIVLGRSIVFGEALQPSNIFIKMDKGIVTAKDSSFNLANSTLKYALDYNITQNILNLKIDPSSHLAMEDILTFQKYFPDSTGILTVGGKVTFVKNDFQIDTQLSLENFKYSDIVLDKAELDFAYQKGEYDFRNYRLVMGQDSFRGKGAWYQNKTSTSNILTGSIARLDLETDSADLKKLAIFTNKLQRQYLDISTRLKEASAEGSTYNVTAVEVKDLSRILYSDLDERNVLNEYKQASKITKEKTLTDLSSNFSGILKGKLSFENNYGSLKIVSNLEIQQGSLAGKKFDQLRLNVLTKDDVVYLDSYCRNLELANNILYEEVLAQAEIASGNLNIKKFNLKREKGNASDFLIGYFPLYALWDKAYMRDPLDLRLKVAGDDLSVIAAYYKNIGSINNDGEIILTLKGTFDKPILNSEKIELNNFSIYMNNPYYQSFQVKRADLEIATNNLEIGNLEMLFSNETEETPLLKLAGSVGLKNWSLARTDSITVQSKLLLKDVDGSLNLKNIYNGDFALMNVSLVGDLFIPLSEAEKVKARQKLQDNAETGPLLTGSLSLSNGNIYLWKLEKDINLKTDKYLSLLLNIDFKIKRDVRVLSKDSILTGDFSNLMTQLNVGLRDENPEVKLEGSLNYLKVNGRIYFDDGYVSFINRKFMIIDRTDQEVYFGAAQQKIKDNYLEFKETDKFTLDPQFYLVAQTTVYETVVSANTAAGVATTGNPVQPVEYLKEKDYLVLIDGSIFDLSSISFERYTKQSSAFVLDGEPYVLQDKTTGKVIDSYRFQELTYDIAPQVFKSAYAMLSGTQEASTAGLTREVARDVTITEINLLMRSVLKPIERNIAKQTGLYDIKIKRDIGKDAARALNLNDQRVLQTEEEVPVDHVVGLEVIKELAKDRVFFSVDTSVDRNLQSEQLNFMIYSYKLTWKIFRDVFLDEISLNYGNELDIYQKQYIPVLSLEGLHSF